MDGRVERSLAVERYRRGESVEAICASLKRSRSWFYKWLDRADEAQPTWCEERSRRPLSTGFYEEALRQQIVEMEGGLSPRGRSSVHR